MKNKRWLAPVILTYCLFSQAFSRGDGPREVNMAAEKGVVFLIDGVGGFGFAPKVMEKVLVEAGVPHELRHFYWSHGFGRWHADLTDDENIRQKASELSDLIMDSVVQKRVGSRCAKHPPGRSGNDSRPLFDPRVRARERPIYVVAKSGGTAIALAALAQLPTESVDRVVLLSSAVSPNYDLAPALRSIRTDLVSFWSSRDKLILGVGTTIFGTADGMMGESAGLVGFRVPEQADAATVLQYRKLRQVEWDPSMRKTHNYGTHIGTSMPLFVREYVAPLIGGNP